MIYIAFCGVQNKDCEVLFKKFSKYSWTSL